MDKKSKAVIYMLISSFTFSVMGALVKICGDVPVFEKVFFRNLFSCIIVLFIVIYHKETLFGKKKNQRALLARSILGTIGMIAYFYCIDNMLLADSSMLNKMHPFFVTIFSVICLKEKIKTVQISGLIGAFIGALLIIKPRFDIQVVPGLIGVLSAAAAGGAYTVVRYLGSREKYYTIVFYFSFVATIITMPFVFLNFKTLNIFQFGILLCTGICAVISQFSLTEAYKYAPASQVALYDYSSIIFSGIIGLMFWSEIPDIFSIIGYMLIIGTGIFIYMISSKS